MGKGFETLTPFLRKSALLGVAGLALALGGCLGDRSEVQTGPQAGAQAGTDGRSTVTKIISGGQAPLEIDPEALSSDIYCPSIRLQPGAHLIMSYERGKQDEPKGLRYQATVQDWARGCVREGADQTRLKVGVSGYVTPGPAWPGGEVLLPVRIVITTGEEGVKPLTSELISVPVTIGAGAPSEAWTMVESSFVVPRNQEMQILVGFDEKATAKR
ncbi:hypothetical protein [Roseibium sp.]|uniref:hypothetical protein n=1 Tax=Roseibium sp. TaxID=1936156 RepID=UPI003A98597C